jgi:NAD(P)-dependent dehydrogenase (short-subunit alcohol dehydrogenase family)
MIEAPLQSQVALVTGAARRIGRAVALDLARQGYAVAVHYGRSETAAGETVAEIVAGGGRAAAVQADLRDESAVQALVPRAAAALGGPVSVLVNNASVFERDTPRNATRQGWDAHMEVNLRAPFVLVQALAGALPEGVDGNVVNVIDQRVWNPTPYFTTYTLSKAGLWTLTRTLALALAPRIRVNAIGPGPTLPSRRQTEEQFARQWRGVPLRRCTGLDEICAAVRFILAAPALTGQMIALDGGQHLGWAHPPVETATEE